MRVLLDTHLVVWWQLQSPRLSSAMRESIETAEAVYVSRVSLWELALKAGLGKLHVDLPQFCRRIAEDGFLWLEISEAHILKFASLTQPDDHKDPFDRLLVAQSLSEPLLLLTVDRKLAQYGNTVRLL